jgi:hypothetical protein
MNFSIQIAGLGLLLVGSGHAFAQASPGSNPFGSKPTATVMGEEQQDQGLDRVRNGFEGKLSTKSGGAAAATAADITVGARVRDVHGLPLGKIDSVTADGIVIDTGQSKVTVPLLAFRKDRSGLLLGVTAAQLTELIANAGPRPANTADIVAGTQLRDVNGQPVGRITAVAADGATVDTGKAQVKLPLGSFGIGSSGLVIPITAQKLNEIIAQSESPIRQK